MDSTKQKILEYPTYSKIHKATWICVGIAGVIMCYFFIIGIIGANNLFLKLFISCGIIICIIEIVVYTIRIIKYRYLFSKVGFSNRGVYYKSSVSWFEITWTNINNIVLTEFSETGQKGFKYIVFYTKHNEQKYDNLVAKNISDKLIYVQFKKEIYDYIITKWKGTPIDKNNFVLKAKKKELLKQKKNRM